MRKPNKAVRITVAAAIAFGAFTATTASATADSGSVAAPAPAASARAAAQEWGGGWNNYGDTAVREKASASSRKVGTLKRGKKIRCWVSACSGTHNGGTYRCSSSSPKETNWHLVRWNGKKAWVASRCMEWGRIA
ncbi:hypothetical protein [Streptomyces kanamyceticus]|uniref:hypothetical protein n=1 Tax=Streptomyces kanamyceticus TaxID=1967 RepID=UPI00123CA2F0|nr:hypothetical protein [Streptomyces kanamyceticus]